MMSLFYCAKRRKKMFEKVNPRHPDKICDRIAGALVDKTYDMDADPKIASGHLMQRVNF